MPVLDDIKKELRACIAEDEFEKVFELFRKSVHDNARLESDLILQQGQYNSVMRSARNGTASPDQTERSLARIRLALIELSNNLKESDLEPGLLQNSIPGNNPMTALSLLEREGLEKQLELSIRRLNALRESLAIQFDPNIKFALETQVAGLEKEIDSLKARLQ